MQDGQGRLAGVILPRLGEAGDTREPLFVSCPPGGQAWPPPVPGQRRGWILCEVRYRHRGLVDLADRFMREVFDKPDIPRPDLRVRRIACAGWCGACRMGPGVPGAGGAR